jgi:hypothetical protein
LGKEEQEMNTGLRRFLLRLAVGLLAFLLGISAAWALGGFNPFRNSSGTRHYRHKSCGYDRSWNAPPPAFNLKGEPAVMHQLVLISPDGRQAHGYLGNLPELPPLAPAAPEPPGVR